MDTPEGQRLLKPALKPQPYRIGPYDNLDIIVWGHPEISTISSSTMPVPGSGNLPSVGGSNNPPVVGQSNGESDYPDVGHLHLSGLTIYEIQSKITHRLAHYIRNPQVTVQVSKFRNRRVY